MKKKCVQIVLFLLLVICALYGFHRIFSIKSGDGIFSIENFYEQPKDSVDVLVLGSSHAFEDISTADLWDEYGIAAYDLGGSEQPLWNTYFYLREALKYQKPKLIVLEAFMATYPEDYQESNRIISNTYGMRLSKNKVSAIFASVPRGERINYLLEYIQYHGRYTDISSADFLKNQGKSMYENWKGFECSTLSKKNEICDVSAVADAVPMTEKNERYFRGIIELARANDIPICVVVSPDANICEADQRIYNYVETVCNEYGVPYLNYNLKYDETGIDPEYDFADDVHLNQIGSQKYTKCLGAFLKENYELPDRRGDERWNSWELDASYVRRVRSNVQFREIGSIESEFEKVDKEGYAVFISAVGETSVETKEQLALLEGLSKEDADNCKVLYYTNGEPVLLLAEEQPDIGVEVDFHTVLFDGEYIYFDHVEVNRVVDNGYNVIVYDPVTQTIVDKFGIWISNPTVCLRGEN